MVTEELLGDLVLSHNCTERGRLVNHEVRMMLYSPEALGRLWEQAKQHRVLFSDDIYGDFHSFCEVFLTMDHVGNIQAKGITWIVDDFLGVFFMNRISQHEATVDFSFFDAWLRLDLTKAMLDYVFKTYGFDRLNVEMVPYAHKRVVKFVEDLGFKWEGRKRKAHIYKGQKFDLILHGLLKEEFYELQS